MLYSKPRLQHKNGTGRVLITKDQTYPLWGIEVCHPYHPSRTIEEVFACNFERISFKRVFEYLQIHFGLGMCVLLCYVR